MAKDAEASDVDSKTTAMASETPTVSSSPASSCSSSEDGSKPKTGLTYLLRSARDWRGTCRVDTLDHKTVKESNDLGEMEQVGTNDEDQVLEVIGAEEGQKEKEVEAEPDAATESSLVVENREDKRFEMTYHCLPDMEEDVEEDLSTADERGTRPMQYLDVLLQTDEHGVGLNVGLGEQGGTALIVQSFRRLNQNDVGPAEACGKIEVGDVLHAVDGEEVSSLQQLHGKLVGRMGKKRKFVLLRFLRPVTGDLDAADGCLFSKRPQSAGKRETSWAEVDALLRSNPQVATLVRQLATTNQVLQEQLIDSRLKQDEQNIQLDQLHALYARTQAEALPLFSLSKSIRPFSRKASATGDGDIGPGKPIPTKIQAEVIDAINAEHSRLRQEFHIQHVLDKRELERKYAEKVKQLEEATTKKVEMLEFGFQQALEHYTNSHNCSCHCHANSESFVGSSQLQHCDYRDVYQTSVKHAEPRRVDLDQIMDLLAKYQKMNFVRTAKLQTLNSTTADTVNP